MFSIWIHDNSFSKVDFVISNQLPFGIGDIIAINQRLFLRIASYETELLQRQPQLQARAFV